MTGKAVLRHPLEGLIIASAVVVGVLLWRREQGYAPPARLPTIMRISPGDTVKRYEEVVLTYIGDVECAQCLTDEFKSDLRTAVSTLRGKLEEQGRLFTAQGVVVSHDLAESIEYFSTDVGLWDELSIGSGWLNSRAGYFAWDVGVRPMTPTLITQVRAIRIAPTGYLQVDGVRTLRTLSGASEIHAVVSAEAWDKLLPGIGSGGNE